jgi:prepilin-type N-terminal cleavage/methylation domain-containing protein
MRALGVTLLELMITVAIVAIIAAIAYRGIKATCARSVGRCH